MYTGRMTWSAQSVEALTSAADHTDIFAPGIRVKIHKVGFLVSVLTSGAATVKFDITNNSGTRGDGDAGAVTVPDATAVGQAIIDTTSTIFPVVINAGQFVTPQVTSAASTAGSGFYFIEYEVLTDTNANDANVAESA